MAKFRLECFCVLPSIDDTSSYSPFWGKKRLPQPARLKSNVVSSGQPSQISHLASLPRESNLLLLLGHLCGLPLAFPIAR